MSRTTHQPVTNEPETNPVPAQGQPTQTDDEMFDRAWDEPEEGGDAAEDQGAGEGAADAEDTGAAEGGEGSTAGGGVEGVSAEGGEAGSSQEAESSEGDAGEAEAGGDASQSEASLKAQIDRLENLLAQGKDDEPEQERERELADQPDQSVYTEDEQAKVDEFKAEWPDVAEGIELLMKDYRQKIMQEMSQQIEPMVSPAVQFAQQTQADQHVQQLEAAHPDYATIYNDIVGWVDGQPEYLKNAYTQVAQNGSTQEVIDLISRFKAETGKAQPEKPQPKAEKRDRTLPDEAKKAAASLGVVNSQRSAQAKAEDPNDFEGAWADATREG